MHAPLLISLQPCNAHHPLCMTCGTAVQITGTPQVARRSDMDMNGHINNVTYLGWALETVPETVATDYTLHEVLLVLMLLAWHILPGQYVMFGRLPSSTFDLPWQGILQLDS